MADQAMTRIPWARARAEQDRNNICPRRTHKEEIANQGSVNAGFSLVKHTSMRREDKIIICPHAHIPLRALGSKCYKEFLRKV